MLKALEIQSLPPPARAVALAALDPRVAGGTREALHARAVLRQLDPVCRPAPPSLLFQANATRGRSPAPLLTPLPGEDRGVSVLTAVRGRVC